jgi:hypothetical protein
VQIDEPGTAFDQLVQAQQHLLLMPRMAKLMFLCPQRNAGNVIVLLVLVEAYCRAWLLKG